MIPDNPARVAGPGELPGEREIEADEGDFPPYPDDEDDICWDDSAGGA